MIGDTLALFTTYPFFIPPTTLVPGARYQALRWERRHRIRSNSCSFDVSSHLYSWLSSLPTTIGKERSVGGATAQDDSEEGDALHRCLCREVSTASALLGRVRGDLLSVEKLCRGEIKATNEVCIGSMGY